MADIRITPAASIMAFTSSLNFKETLTQEASGSLTLLGSGSTGRTDLFTINGNNGTLFSVSDDLSNSLFSVNTIAGLPVIEAFADNTVVMGQYGQNVLVVTGSKVGVGTSTPLTKLQVTINDNAFAGAALLENTNSGTSALSTISFKTANNASTFAVGQVNNGGGAILYNGANASMTFSTNASTRMTIAAGGNVGIGTTNPSNPLHTYQSFSNFIQIETSGTPSNYSTYLGTSGANSILSNTPGMALYLDGGADIIFRPVGSESMRLTFDNKVGIGTSTPSQKLDVTGYINSTKYITTQQEPFTSQDNWSGDVIEGLIHGSVGQWDLVYLDPSTDNWYMVDDANQSSTYLLGIYLGGDLVLLEGHIVVNDGSSANGPSIANTLQSGLPIYIRDGTTIGDMSVAIPTTSGNFVRILGHAYYKSSGTSGNYIMKFRPSNDWVQL
jgi:hypothetical protein